MVIGAVSNYAVARNQYQITQDTSEQLAQTTDAYNQDSASKQKSEEAPKEQQLSQKRGNISIEEVSLTFHKNNTFEALGTEGEWEKPDMSKVFSDMKKDRILQDYSYFVGNRAGQVRSASEDGVVITK